MKNSDNNIFDTELRNIAEAELNSTDFSIPENVTERINETLNSLPDSPRMESPQPERKAQTHALRNGFIGAIAAAFAILFILPNSSANVAYAMQQLPVIGDTIKIITVRQYNKSNENHDLDVEIPGITGMDSDTVLIATLSDVEKLTNKLVDKFYYETDNMTDNGHSSLKISYDVITNNEKWFTLRITVTEAAASGYTYYEYYHIDRTRDEITELSDLFKDGSDYQQVISREIIRQMREQIKNDDDVSYNIDQFNSEWEFTTIDANQNFYFNKNGNIVIVFDKYDVAPGSMGCPEFEIPAELYKDLLV